MSETTSKFDEFEELKKFKGLDLNNLLFEIWFKPKLVFTYLKKYTPTQYVQILLIISALTTTFERAISKNIVWNSSYEIGYFLGGFIFGAFLTWALYLFSAWFLHYFGRAFLNGNASVKDFRLVIAWSNIPIIASILLSFFLLIIYGSNALSDSFQPVSETIGIVYIVVGVIEIGLVIWSLAITVIGIMVIQNFNLWKAIGNIAIPIILFILVFIAVFSIGGVIL